MKNKLFKLYIFIISLSLLGAKCGKFAMDRRYSLHLVNYSDRNVFIMINTDGILNDPVYPDTTLSSLKPNVHPILAPNQKKMFRDGSLSWDKVYQNVKNDTLSFAIYDADTLAKYPWETIREQYLILQRYDLSIQDLQKLDYTLYYPPTEAMREMKMYPAYGN